MNIFSILACLSLIWLLMVHFGLAHRPANVSWLQAVTLVAIVVLSLWLFGRGITIDTVRVR